MVRSSLFAAAALLTMPAQTNADAIHLAARKGDVAAIEKLLGEGVPADLPSTRNTSLPGVAALYVASQFGRVDAARLLLSEGADPSIYPAVEGTDGTPMHMAARRGSIEIVEMILDHGVDPNIYDQWLGTPLHQAHLNSNEQMVSFLTARGAETEWRAPSIQDLIPDADIENGRAFVKGCAGLCHGIEPTAAERSLWDIVGAEKASRPGYEYSKALTSLGGTWSIEELNIFIASPFRYAPGSGMIYSIPDQKERADVLAYLLTLSDNPVSER